jgi:hypothetical protein
VDLVLRALSMAFAMGWEILWPLILGFTLSAVVEAVVSHQQMSRLLPDDRPRSIVRALALGAASYRRHGFLSGSFLGMRAVFEPPDGYGRRTEDPVRTNRQQSVGGLTNGTERRFT